LGLRGCCDCDRVGYDMAAWHTSEVGSFEGTMAKRGGCGGQQGGGGVSAEHSGGGIGSDRGQTLRHEKRPGPGRCWIAGHSPNPKHSENRPLGPMDPPPMALWRFCCDFPRFIRVGAPARSALTSPNTSLQGDPEHACGPGDNEESGFAHNGGLGPICTQARVRPRWSHPLSPAQRGKPQECTPRPPSVRGHERDGSHRP
jgi:hypothetical protein